MSKWAFALVALLVLVACGDATAPPSPALVAFRLDAATCRGSADFQFFIDGASVGRANLAAGAAEEFTVRPGEHIAGFQMDNIPIVYTSTLRVESGQRFTLLMTCASS